MLQYKELQDMDERDFQILSVLNKVKNITHAADILYITQSALSKRIATIEQELNITLLIRSRQGVHFTPEGEEVLHYTDEARSILAVMRKSIESKRSYICGTLNLGISINYAKYRLSDIISAYRTKYEQVTMHIVTDQSRQLYLKVLNGDIDIAIIRGEYSWPGKKILLDRESICAIYPPGSTEKERENFTYIGRKTDSVFERELAQWLHENNIYASPNGIQADSISTCVDLVNKKLGWAIVPEICLHEFNGEIQPLFFENGEPFIRSTYLMYSETAEALPQVKVFIETIRDLQKKNYSTHTK